MGSFKRSSTQAVRLLAFSDSTARDELATSYPVGPPVIDQSRQFVPSTNIVTNQPCLAHTRLRKQCLVRIKLDVGLRLVIGSSPGIKCFFFFFFSFSLLLFFVLLLLFCLLHELLAWLAAYFYCVAN